MLVVLKQIRKVNSENSENHLLDKADKAGWKKMDATKSKFKQLQQNNILDASDWYTKQVI